MTGTTETLADHIISTIRAERSTGQTRAGKPAKGFKTRTTADGSTVYEAQLGFSGTKIYLGTFSTPEEATAAYVAAKARVQELKQQAKGDA